MYLSEHLGTAIDKAVSNANKMLLSGATPPDIATVGNLGQFYLDTLNGEMYILAQITQNDEYLWQKYADARIDFPLKLLGLYATLQDLQTAHPTAVKGDAYAVGDETYNEIYVWDGVQWVNLGSLKTEGLFAEEVSYNNSVSELDADNVQSAIDEVVEKLNEIDPTYGVGEEDKFILVRNGRWI